MIFKVKSLWRTAWGDWYIDIGVAEIKLIVCRLKRRFVLKNNKYCRDKISKPLALQRNWRPTNSRQNFTWCKAKKSYFKGMGELLRAISKKMLQYTRKWIWASRSFGTASSTWSPQTVQGETKPDFPFDSYWKNAGVGP